jgi:hypothetical protein
MVHGSFCTAEQNEMMQMMAIVGTVAQSLVEKT